MYTRITPKNIDAGLLLIRIALGVGFMLHGIQKLQGIDMTVGFFGKLGFPPALAWFVALVETLGGAAMLLGIFTEVSGLLLASVMIVAILKVKLGSGKGYLGFELDAAYLLSSLAIVLTGPGKYSLRGLMKKKPNEAHEEMAQDQAQKME